METPIKEKHIRVQLNDSDLLNPPMISADGDRDLAVCPEFLVASAVTRPFPRASVSSLLTPLLALACS